ncbi:hypothetical protein H5U35_01565 [Candidatus Aerophobetes bacterium]|nr:hypothetical protein [Candidatus Aerophobetes bacterium]
MNVEDKEWILDNFYRRKIINLLEEGEKTFDELKNTFKITLSPLVAQYKPRTCLFISPFALENHLRLLLRENMVEKKGEKYQVKKA